MSKTIEKKLLEHILTDRIESYTKFKNNLEPNRDSYIESKQVFEERISAMYHVIEILNDTDRWIRNMGDAKLEKLGLNIEDYE
jgi:hypothetical protein